MTEYSVAICNFNMANTVEQSLRSILRQLDNRFEVVVVDDGSTDGSLDILRNLEKDYNKLRVLRQNNNSIAEARNASFEAANGKYILSQLDTDDEYSDCITDFVSIYHSIEEVKNRSFYLSGNGLNMAPATLHKEYPYREMGYGEDKDLWRRLFADDRIIWLDHYPPHVQIGYERSLVQQLQTAVEIEVTEFRSGITYQSYLKYWIKELPSKVAFFKLVTSPISFLRAIQKGRYSAPNGFKEMGTLEKQIEARKHSVQELEDIYGIDIESKLSAQGKEIFMK